MKIYVLESSKLKLGFLQNVCLYVWLPVCMQGWREKFGTFKWKVVSKLRKFVPDLHTVYFYSKIWPNRLWDRTLRGLETFKLPKQSYLLLYWQIKQINFELTLVFIFIEYKLKNFQFCEFYSFYERLISVKTVNMLFKVWALTGLALGQYLLALGEHVGGELVGLEGLARRYHLDGPRLIHACWVESDITWHQ